MLPAGQPKFRRRKADRPDEIVAAALEIFSEKGFAAARLDDIALRAGVSKGALYLYFETKEDLFQRDNPGITPSAVTLCSCMDASVTSGTSSACSGPSSPQRWSSACWRPAC